MNLSEKRIILSSLIHSLAVDIADFKDPEKYKISLELYVFIIDKCRIIGKLGDEIQEEKELQEGEFK